MHTIPQTHVWPYTCTFVYTPQLRSVKMILMMTSVYFRSTTSHLIFTLTTMSSSPNTDAQHHSGSKWQTTRATHPVCHEKKYCKQIVQTVIIARYHQHMHVLSNNTRSHHHYFFLLLLFSLLCTEKQWEKNAKLEHRENDSFSLVLFFGPNEDSFFSLLFVFTGALPFLIRWFIFLVNGVSSSW